MKQRESVNVVAGRALRKLVEWDGLAERGGLGRHKPRNPGQTHGLTDFR